MLIAVLSDKVLIGAVLAVVSVLPILIMKNGIRIVAVSLLSIYVSRKFLHGWLHTSGGIVFYLLGLALLNPVAIILRKSEKRVKSVSGIVFSPAGAIAEGSVQATPASSSTHLK